MVIDERDAMLTLLLTPGLGQGLVGRCLEMFGSASSAVAASGSKLGQVRGIAAKKAGELRRAMDRVIEEEQVGTEKLLTTRYGVKLISIEEEAYPQLLRHIPDPPRLLWVRGTLEATDALSLAMVGSRRCSHYGREQADRLGAMAAEAGLCVVSGGAYGIDAAAHQGAIRVGGRTIAVIGSGLADPYPKPNAGLFDRIVNGHGAVISELPMRTPPRPEQFPARNRIISGLSLGTLVVEAAQRSGALITARLCVEEHGRECMAIPGRVDAPGSAGCHKLIREGCATLVTNIADVLDCLGETGELLKISLAAPPETPETPEATTTTSGGGGGGVGMTQVQREMVGVMTEPQTLDQIAAHTGLEIQQVQAELTMLEIRGAVRRQNGLFVSKR